MASRISTRPHARPLSPHLQIWRWGPHMLVSIIHRALGVGMALVGAPLLVWWLASIAAGDESYAYYLSWFTGDGWRYLGYLLGIGLSWAVLQHMASGIRHLVLDTGAGYELRRNKVGALATMGLSVLGLLLYWAYILGVK